MACATLPRSSLEWCQVQLPSDYVHNRFIAVAVVVAVAYDGRLSSDADADADTAAASAICCIRSLCFSITSLRARRRAGERRRAGAAAPSEGRRWYARLVLQLCLEAPQCLELLLGRAVDTGQGVDRATALFEPLVEAVDLDNRSS